jgi:hypothetical protein
VKARRWPACAVFSHTPGTKCAGLSILNRREAVLNICLMIFSLSLTDPGANRSGQMISELNNENIVARTKSDQIPISDLA